MSRPLLTADIAKLERLYFAGERDCMQLRQLEHELEFRKTSRAEVLAGKVTVALKKLTNGKVPNVVALPPVSPPTILPVHPPAQPTEPSKQRISSASLTTELREAYAALKLAPDAAWEDIEGSRRHIVAQASPAAVAGLPRELVDGSRTAAANANRAAAILADFAAKKR
jgi:hypothetical protein